MKTFFRLLSLVFLGLLCSGMLITDFFKPCSPGRGTDLSCVFLTGQVAKIDSSANISIFAYEPFTIGYLNPDGTTQKVTSLSIGGWSSIDLTATGPAEIMMLKSSSGLDFPMIRVNQSIADSYPSLEVTRTWFHPLTQLVQWYLFPVFLLALFLGTFFLVASFKLRD